MEGDFEKEFAQSVREAAKPEQKQPKKWLKPAVLTSIAAIVVVVSIFAITKLVRPKENVERPQLGDITAVKETVNSEFAAAIKGTPHETYVAERKDTTYSNYAPSSLCNKLGAPCKNFAHPAESPNFRKVETLNSNSIDYYLDNSHVIIMLAAYELNDTPDPYPYVIYARRGGLYYVFDPISEFNVQLTKSEILDGVIGVPEFYISKEGVNGGN